VLWKSFIQSPGFDLAAAAESGWGRAFEMRDYQITLRVRMSKAISSLAVPCEDALGALWNLSSGPNSLAAKAAGANFLDAGQYYIAQQRLDAYGISATGATTFADLFRLELDTAAVVDNWQGRPGNTMILRPGFSNLGASMQNALLVHEMLHIYTGFDDPTLANTLGLPQLLGRHSSPEQNRTWQALRLAPIFTKIA
jgi:hypothetical protein